MLFGAAVTLGILAGPGVEDVLFTPSREARLVEAGSYEPVPEGSVGPIGKNYDSMTQAQRAAVRAGGVFMVDGRAVRAVDTGQVVPEGSGSIERWLDGNYGQPFPGWLGVMMFPAAVLVPGPGRGVMARP